VFALPWTWLEVELFFDEKMSHFFLAKPPREGHKARFCFEFY